MRGLGRHARLSVTVACATALNACRQPENQTPPERSAPLAVAAPSPPRPLEAEFLMRAVLALRKQLGADLRLLEVQAIPFAVSFQIEKQGKVVEYVYEESQDPAEPGQIRGPEQAPLEGQGELDKNLFPLSEIDLDGIGKSFEVARKSVDPEDGKVERLIVRRFFPFGDGIRARVFVYSPRMPGSIDTNPNGVPLRR